MSPNPFPPSLRPPQDFWQISPRPWKGPPEPKELRKWQLVNQLSSAPSSRPLATTAASRRPTTRPKLRLGSRHSQRGAGRQHRPGRGGIPRDLPDGRDHRRLHARLADRRRRREERHLRRRERDHPALARARHQRPVLLAGRCLIRIRSPIVDRRVTIEGSYNFSAGAAWNSEDLNLVTSPEVAAAYAAHWQARQAVSVRFADASEWCVDRRR